MNEKEKNKQVLKYLQFSYNCTFSWKEEMILQILQEETHFLRLFEKTNLTFGELSTILLWLLIHQKIVVTKEHHLKKAVP